MNSKRSKDKIRESAQALSKLLADSPDRLDLENFKRGSNLVGLFEDKITPLLRYPNSNALKQEVLLVAIEDISGGLMILRTSVIGVCLLQNQIRIFSQTHGTLPEGNTIFSIAWKDLVAFRRWRTDSELEIPQEDLNAAIYYLTHALSKMVMAEALGSKTGKSSSKDTE